MGNGVRICPRCGSDNVEVASQTTGIFGSTTWHCVSCGYKSNTFPIGPPITLSSTDDGDSSTSERLDRRAYTEVSNTWKFLGPVGIVVSLVLYLAAHHVIDYLAYSVFLFVSLFITGIAYHPPLLYQYPVLHAIKERIEYVLLGTLLLLLTSGLLMYLLTVSST